MSPDFAEKGIIMLDKRLMECALYVTRGSVAADIGTDHAYLPVYLIKSGISRFVYACDIKDGPLEAARASVAREGLDEKISVLKSDGLDSVPLDGITDIIAAGIGGETIAQIIDRCNYIKKNRVNLVLQPMTRAYFLRRFLCENGFAIKAESAVSSGEFCYTVINAEYMPGEAKLDEYYFYTGELSNKKPDDIKYLNRLINKLTVSGEGMKRSLDKKTEGEKNTLIANRIAQFLKEGNK